MQAESVYLREDLGEGVQVLTTTKTAPGAAGQFGFNLATHVDDDPAAVSLNRRLLNEALGLGREPVWLDQYHSDEVVDVDIEIEGPGLAPIRTDGSFTRQVGLPLAILTADCLPIVLSSSEAVSVVHAGWRGLASGIISCAFKKFRGPVRAWIGAGIGPCHYEVDDAVAKHFPNRTAFQATHAGHYQFDLRGEAKRQLAELGVTAISGLEVCTSCDDRFYSHRAEAPTGRFATLAWRELA